MEKPIQKMQAIKEIENLLVQNLKDYDGGKFLSLPLIKWR